MRRVSVSKLVGSGLFVCGWLVLIAPSIQAQTDERILLEPWGEGKTLEMNLDFLHVDDVNLRGGTTHYSARLWESDARLRLEPENPDSIVLGHSIDYFDTGGSVVDSVDHSAVVGLPIGQHDEWQFHLLAGAGWAGNRVYENTQAIYGLATVMATKPLDESASLTLMLIYDGNRGLLNDIPLPGIAYQRTVGDTWRYTVGFPRTTIVWTPDVLWTITAQYMAPLEGFVDVDYEIIENWHIFGRYENKFWSLHLHDSDHQSVLVEERRAEGGVRWQMCENAQLYVAGGYSFDTKQQIGYDLLDATWVGGVTDAWFGRIGVEFSY